MHDFFERAAEISSGSKDGRSPDSFAVSFLVRGRCLERRSSEKACNEDPAETRRMVQVQSWMQLGDLDSLASIVNIYISSTQSLLP